MNIRASWEYIDRWKEWIKKYGSDATIKEIFEFKDQLKRQFNLDNYDEHPYKKR